MVSYLSGPYRSWKHSWLTWLLTNLLGTSGTLLYAKISSEGLGYPAFVCGVVAVGSLPLLPLIRFVLASTLDSRRQGWRLLAFWGTVLAAYATVGLMLSGFGGFSGIIALTGWPYLPAALVGSTLANWEWLFRGSDA
jgi:hypothetical protein